MKIYFIGIGGIGVSALARYFLARGCEISGSDAAGSEITEELGKLGAKINLNPPNPPLRKGGELDKGELDKGVRYFKRRVPDTCGQVDLVVYSAAVREDNSELVEARRLNIKTQKYAEALGELTRAKYTIAISGMHGKSTTTAMIGLIMEKAGLDPTVILGTKVRWKNANHNSPLRYAEGYGEASQPPLKLRGGKIPPNPPLRKGGGNAKSPLPPLLQSGEENYSNCRVGQSKYLVIEADEYDKSILNYWPKLLVLLNLEEEHLDTYKGGLPEIMETFNKYVSHLPEEGVLVANQEDKNIRKIFNSPPFGWSPAGRQFSILNENSNSKHKFYIEKYGTKEVAGLKLKITGQHNLSNANAALAVARVLGIDEKIAVEALNDFSGAWRRMEYKGELNGAKIYDDYGHHPTEIKATLEGARELIEKFNPPNPPLRKGGIDDDMRRAISGKRLWCVFQPHQYHRTYDLFDQFVGAFGAADKVILLPIYSVTGREDEEIKQKINSEKLAEAIKTINNKKEILYMENFDAAEEYLRGNLRSGDVCVIMGAGDIYKLTGQLFNKK